MYNNCVPQLPAPPAIYSQSGAVPWVGGVGVGFGGGWGWLVTPDLGDGLRIFILFPPSPLVQFSIPPRLVSIVRQPKYFLPLSFASARKGFSNHCFFLFLAFCFRQSVLSDEFYFCLFLRPFRAVMPLERLFLRGNENNRKLLIPRFGQT